jgi:hypothetical protein
MLVRGEQTEIAVALFLAFLLVSATLTSQKTTKALPSAMPPKPTGKKETYSYKYYRPRRYHPHNRPTGLATFLKKRDRTQEHGEYLWNTRLQVVTIFFLFTTTVGVFYQACILNNTDLAVQEETRINVRP